MPKIMFSSTSIKRQVKTVVLPCALRDSWVLTPM